MLSENQRVVIQTFGTVWNELLDHQIQSEAPYLTLFDARKPPAISLSKYFERIVKFAPCSFECYTAAFCYLKRISELHPDFIFTPYNIHRLLITSVMLAVKFHEDFYYSNAFYAKLGGIPLIELNNLEIQFLLIIDFELTIREEDYLRHMNSVLKCLDELTQERYLLALRSEENSSVSEKFSKKPKPKLEGTPICAT